MHFAVSDVSEGVTGKFGCNLFDYEETILAPFIENVQKAEELRGLVSLSIHKPGPSLVILEELFARADAGKSTIEKIKSRENLPLNGSMRLHIDHFEYNLSFNGLIDLSSPFYSDEFDSALKVCFGKLEICDYLTNIIGSPIFYSWFLTKMLIEKEARIIFGQFQMKLSINGDLGSAIDKILRDQTFQFRLKYQIDSDKSYVRFNYNGKTSTSKFVVMMGKFSGPLPFCPLEYFYNQATEIFALVIVDNAKYFQASGCSEDLCNDPKDIIWNQELIHRTIHNPLIL